MACLPNPAADTVAGPQTRSGPIKNDCIIFGVQTRDTRRPPDTSGPRCPSLHRDPSWPQTQGSTLLRQSTRVTKPQQTLLRRASPSCSPQTPGRFPKIKGMTNDPHASCPSTPPRSMTRSLLKCREWPKQGKQPADVAYHNPSRHIWPPPHGFCTRVVTSSLGDCSSLSSSFIVREVAALALEPGATCTAASQQSVHTCGGQQP